MTPRDTTALQRVPGTRCDHGAVSGLAGRDAERDRLRLWPSWSAMQEVASRSWWPMRPATPSRRDGGGVSPRRRNRVGAGRRPPTRSPAPANARGPAAILRPRRPHRRPVWHSWSPGAGQPGGGDRPVPQPQDGRTPLVRCCVSVDCGHVPSWFGSWRTRQLSETAPADRSGGICFRAARNAAGRVNEQKWLARSNSTSFLAGASISLKYSTAGSVSVTTSWAP